MPAVDGKGMRYVVKEQGKNAVEMCLNLRRIRRESIHA